MQSSAPNPTQPAHIPQGGLASSVLFQEGAGLGPEPLMYASGQILPENKVQPDLVKSDLFAACAPMQQHTMRFGSTAKVLLKCKLKYYRISECNTFFWSCISF